jgi:hypothetical protein
MSTVRCNITTVYYLLAFVDKTQSGKIRSVKMLEKEGLAVECVDREMISAVWR